MSYSKQTLATATYERLKAGNPTLPSSLLPRLVVLVDTALRMLPQRVREQFGSAEAELYRKNYQVELTNGQGALAPHTNLDSEAMIPSEISKVTHPNVVTDTNATGKLYRVGSEASLNLDRTGEYSYFAIEDNTLYTAKDNDRTSLNDEATVRAAYPPLIENVKASHQPMLLELMFELAQGMEAASE